MFLLIFLNYVETEEAQRNNEALKDGSRIFSAYVLNEGMKVWVITEAADEDDTRSGQRFTMSMQLYCRMELRKGDGY